MPPEINRPRPRLGGAATSGDPEAKAELVARLGVQRRELASLVAGARRAKSQRPCPRARVLVCRIPWYESSMIRKLGMTGVGPASHLELTLGARTTVLTGDNGLGKSFILELAFWALTRTWSGAQAVPRLGTNGQAPTGTLSAEVIGRTGEPTLVDAKFDAERWRWVSGPGRPANPGVVIHARVDGGFVVWDPARNWGRAPSEDEERAAPYVFDDRSLWNGLAIGERRACEGILRDWVSWQRTGGTDFERLTDVLSILSTAEEPLVPGEPVRVSPEDSLDVPTVSLPYGTIPLTHASAGVRRVVGLAYLLVWARREHERATALRGWSPERTIVLLVDEPETHLHPRWQRLLLPALLGAAQSLGDWQVQLVAATHAPLVLASLETSFDPSVDQLIDLEMVRDGSSVDVQARPIPFQKLGDVSAWLTSEVFGLGAARSAEAEVLLNEASAALADPAFDAEAAREIDRRLRSVLGELDPFWVRWRYVSEKRGWT